VAIGLAYLGSSNLLPVVENNALCYGYCYKFDFNVLVKKSLYLIMVSSIYSLEAGF
jgi:hypothetical protein